MNRTTTRLTLDTELSRRHILAMLAAGAGTIALAACGGSGTTDTPPVATPASTAPTATKAPIITAPAPGVSTAAANGSVTAGQNSLPTLMIEAVEYGFHTNGSVPAGMTMAQMKNLGQEDHQTQFMRLNDGVTLAQVQAAFQMGERATATLATLTTLVGGPGTASAGGTSTAMMNLSEGQYLLACFIPGRDGIPHAAKGMVLPLTVTPATAPAAPAPTTQGTVMMREFSYILSTSTLPAGRSMLAVINEGAQAHEFGLLRLVLGKSAADVTGYFAATPTGPPPFASAGGLTALSPRERGIAVLDLTPGSYAAVCFLPDAASGKEHLQLGMIAGLTVT
ncbi:MAG: hypothetical protein ACR2M3_07765 [Thermomicrobiales bacterium]